ncbi:MAG: glycosyltransferase family 4 protein [archaeon]|nr:glycosyltransferase family 4 protein [archaeon]
MNDKFTRSGSGGQYRIQGLSKYLAKLGVKISLCCPYYTVQSVDEIRDPPLNPVFPYNYYLNTIGTFTKLRAIHDADVYLIELPCPMVKGLVGLHAEIQRRRLFIDYGDYWSSDEDPITYKIFSDNLARLYARIANKITVATHALMHQIAWLAPEARDKMAYMPCGVDLELFNPDTVKPYGGSEIPNDALVVLYQGKVSTFTGCQYLPSIAENIVGGGKKDVIFLVVGEGPYLPTLKCQVSSEGLEGNFIFTGHISHSIMPSFVARADICLVLTPRRKDVDLGVFPIKIVEYMAMGKPVISTDLPEVPWILTKDRDGIYGSIDSIPSMVNLLLEDASLRKKLGQNALITAKKYDWSLLAKNLLAFWLS